MPKLVYWVVPCEGDHPCYNIRTKTKKEAIALATGRDCYDTDEVRKVEVFYKDAFDLLTHALSECSIYEG